MERAAIYRRALAPTMWLTGVVGLGAAVAGWALGVNTPRGFIGYWLGVSVVPMVGSFLLIRRQALRDKEAIWSPPTRRVVQALLPAFLAGFGLSVAILVRVGGAGDPMGKLGQTVVFGWLPLGWIILYGCAAHAAGFFMPRGIKLFGWAFVLMGCGLFALGVPPAPSAASAHGLMAVFFGGLHLAYGTYLYVTERRRNAV